jgi:DNA invertase Pin-like site-specific DNA recombinase
MPSGKAVRAAIYARVSTLDQNPDAQLLVLREYVEQRGFILQMKRQRSRCAIAGMQSLSPSSQLCAKMISASNNRNPKS